MRTKEKEKYVLCCSALDVKQIILNSGEGHVLAVVGEEREKKRYHEEELLLI